MDDDDLLLEEYTSPGYQGDSTRQIVEDMDRRLSPSSSLNDSDDDDEHGQSHVEVELIESTLNTGDVFAAAAEGAYVVAEPSSDEEDDDAQREYDWKTESSVQVHEISS